MTVARIGILVIGGGMAGLCAALAARQRGADVTLIEADAEPGGAARWSSGRIWTLPDYETFRRLVPLGDLRLQGVLAAGFRDALRWLASQAGPLLPQPLEAPGSGAVMQLGQAGDRSAFLAALAERVAAEGVTVLFGTRARAVHRHGDGALAVEAGAPSGRPLAWRAGAVVLATGGFQRDVALLAEHLGPEARRLMVRSNTTSLGDGFRLGRMLGGTPSRGMSGFYGKSMPLHAETLAPHEYKGATLDAAKSSIAVSAEGRRFADESGGLSGECLAGAGLYQPGGRYHVVAAGDRAARLPRRVFRDLAHRAGVPEDDVFVEAANPRALAEAMARHWRIPATALLDTFAEVDEAAAAADGGRLLPSRSTPPAPLAGRLAAVACQPAITIPFGGLHVDELMRLLRADGESVSDVFVAGADAGGVYVGAYAGGLAWALVSGRTAGMTAAASLAGRMATAVAP